MAALKYVQRPSAGAAGKGAGQYSVFNLGTGASPPCGCCLFFPSRPVLFFVRTLASDPLTNRTPSRLACHGTAWHGTAGVGYSVLDMVNAMKAASGRPLPYVFGPRRCPLSIPI